MNVGYKKEGRMMNIDEKPFIQLVEEMRNAQKEYFRTRNPQAIDLAKKLEKEVDERIKTSRQPRLF